MELPPTCYDFVRRLRPFVANLAATINKPYLVK